MTANPALAFLPPFIRNLLGSPPEEGAGLHYWIYRMACHLKRWCSDAQAGHLLAAATAQCRRDVTREITEAIRNARCSSVPFRISRGLETMLPQAILPPRPARWPRADWGKIQEIASLGHGLADMWEASPFRLDSKLDAAEFLRHLFPGNPLLCLAKKHPADAQTMHLESWTRQGRGPSEYAMMVPSPMTAPTGRGLNGRVTNRCLDNTALRRFLVVEFDFKACDQPRIFDPAAALLRRLRGERNPRTAPDLCAALLLHLLRCGAPLALAVHSGGKSVHGWFTAVDAPDEFLRAFFADACRLGADPATWCRCQLVRIPAGTRGDGRPQRVFYFDPSKCPPD